MAICNLCDREMLDPATVSRIVRPIAYVGEAPRPQVPYRNEDGRELCHDCSVAAGGVHHPGCDMEECPRCGHQLLSCECELQENVE